MTDWTPTEDEQWFVDQLRRLGPEFGAMAVNILRSSYLRGQFSGLEQSKVSLNEFQSKVSDLFAKPLPQPPRIPSFWEFLTGVK